MILKYIILLGDGMADYPIADLGDKTPLQYAKKSNMDALARKGEMGLMQTIPENLPPGSDVANLSTMGFDPEKYYTGRSPLEAVSIGIELDDKDISLRMNLVTLSEVEDYKDKTIVDHSSGGISNEEAAELIKSLKDAFDNEYVSIYQGVSYRHILIWKEGLFDIELTPPHDILGKTIGDYLPKNKDTSIFLDMMEKSYEILKNHPINLKRKARGLNPANSVWFWGQGQKPMLPNFKETYGLKGSVISAVDLIKGIGIAAGLRSIDVEGATGELDTNFKGKALAALEELEKGQDFVYLHLEAPDECGHNNDLEGKVKAIELIDELCLGILLEGLEKWDRYKIMVLPDHATPLSLRTHSRDPIPYIIYDSGDEKTNDVLGYDEFEAKKSGILLKEGHKLMGRFLL